MTQERNGVVTMKGNPLTLIGPEIAVGQQAPDFQVAAGDLSPVSLGDLAGKVKLIAAVPSLDTPVCDKEARTFNERLAALGSDVVGVVVSMDLPFAQGRWCGAYGIDGIRVLSDYQQASFGAAYGCLIKGLRLLARAVFVLDRNDNVTYVQYVPEATAEPDYEAALAAVKSAL